MAAQLAFCKVNIAPLRKEAADSSEMVSQLLFGELVEVRETNKPWAKIIALADNYEGFVDCKQLEFISEKEARKWMDSRQMMTALSANLMQDERNFIISKGAYIGDSDNFQIGKHMFQLSAKSDSLTYKDPFEFAESYLGTSYLWGGKNAFGIDCSALMQICFRPFDKNLPRDAWQQAEIGLEIHFDEKQRNDLAFFTNDKGKIIHVGICSENAEIIHASGEVRKDELTSEGIRRTEDRELTHKLHCILRF